MYRYRGSRRQSVNRKIRLGVGILCMAAAVGMFGCAKKTAVQEEMKTVEKEYSKGQVMVVAATERNRYQNVYTSRLWKVQADSSGITFEDKLTKQIEQFLTELAVINLMADEKNVELTGQEKDALKNLSQEYYRSLLPDDQEYMDVSEEEVYRLYCEYYRADKLVKEMTEGEDLEVSDAEAKVIQIQQIALEDATEAQRVLEQVRGEKADFGSIASRNSKEGQINHTLEWSEDMDILGQEAFGLEQDEISDVVEKEGKFYILKCINAYDSQATMERKSQLSREKKTQAFLSFYEPFIKTHQVKLKGNIREMIDFSEGERCESDHFFQLYQSYFN